jgi:hypothetical protein
MNDALFGYSGFVGSTLLTQRSFDRTFRSTDLESAKGESFELCVCASAPAQKWLANKNPEEDKAQIERLIDTLSTISAKRFVLVSTVDVFSSPLLVDESTVIDEANLVPYGLNRRFLEKFVESNFPDRLIVRLPGLVGEGLKKNVIYDFLHNNNLDAVDHRAIFQFYPMKFLWRDIQIAMQNDLELIHLTSAPIDVGAIARDCFSRTFENAAVDQPPVYDFRTIYSNLFGREGHYQYDLDEVKQVITDYASGGNEKREHS